MQLVVFKRVLVCGGSRSTPWSAVLDALDRLAAEFQQEAARLNDDLHITVIHEGRTTGPGGYADGWAVTNKASVEEFPLDWMPHGAERNRSIIELGQPDVVLAFVGNPRTLELVSEARKAGIKVHVSAASSREKRRLGKTRRMPSSGRS